MKILFLILLFLTMGSCNNIENNPKNENIVHKKEDDTLKAKNVDTLNGFVEDFNSFFERFSRDSLFQKSRIIYPLKWYSSEYGNEGLSLEYIDKDQYTYIDFSLDKDAMNREFDKYYIKIEKFGDDKIDYIQKGDDNGILTYFHFQRINQLWNLTKVKDMSN